MLVGLMLYCRLKNNFSEAKAVFRISELLHLLGWPDNGGSRRKLKQGLDRLAGVKLKFENSWRSEEGEEYEREFVTGILDGYELAVAKDESKPGKREFTSVQWSAEVFADIQRGNVKELNTGEYFALQRPLSKRMYRFLDKHLVTGQTFEMNLLKFVGHMGMSEISHIGKIRERLKEPLLDLESLGTLIKPAIDADRYHRLGVGDWLIRFDRAGSTTAGKSAEPARSPEPAQLRLRSKRSKPKETPGAAKLVKLFYELWCDNPLHEPSYSELKHSQGLIDQHGESLTEELLPIVVKLLRERFPNAASFGATKNFWHLAKQQVESKKMSHAKRQQQQSTARVDEERRHRDQQRRRKLQGEWNRLDETQQQEVRREVLQDCTDFVRQKIERKEFDDSLVMIECLNRLDERRDGGRTTAP